MVVAGYSSACVRLKSIGGQDFNCSETSTRDRDKLGGFVGDATTRENSGPSSKRFSAMCFIILSGWKQSDGTSTASDFQRQWTPWWQTSLLISKEEKSLHDCQIADPMRLKETAYAGTHPHESDRRAYTLTVGNNMGESRGDCFDACNHSLTVSLFGRFNSSHYLLSKSLQA